MLTSNVEEGDVGQEPDTRYITETIKDRLSHRYLCCEKTITISKVIATDSAMIF